jgi:RNA polymerase sigma-70 factor (ECF subfamily)
MESTPASLLERLRRPNEQDAWGRFVELYTPLIYHWARRAGLSEHDAADLVQEVFAVLVLEMPRFVHDKSKSFRAWLRTVTLNKWRERQRRRSLPIADGAAESLYEIAAPATAEAVWETEYREHLASRVLELMQKDFQPTTWKACWELVVSGRSAAEVAAELGLTVGAAHAAKFRVLARLRQELAGMMD